MKLIIALVSILVSINASAFVENVTHGYPNCLACHVSPSGGGLLNDYGRSLSKELMSTWGWKGSEDPLFGAVKNKEWLKVGGDIRTIQTYLENSNVKQGRQFNMQRNVELGVKADKTWFVGTFGSQEGPEGTPHKGDFLSERHFLLWDTSEDTKVRVGKFRLNYGIYEANHTRVTKSPLGFGSNSETYNLEFSKMTDNYEMFLSSGLGRIDIPRDQSSERNIAATYVQYINSKAKAGVSALIGESQLQRRSLVGLFGISPLFEKGVLKSEVDFQRSNSASAPDRQQDLFSGYISTGYFLAKGFYPYLFIEYLHQDLNVASTKQEAPGFGVQWLPLPHVELQAEFKRQVIAATPGTANNIGWFVFHLYL